MTLCQFWVPAHGVLALEAQPACREETQAAWRRDALGEGPTAMEAHPRSGPLSLVELPSRALPRLPMKQ